jgi:ABC-2 type transport system ATP-binding protein
VPADTFADLPGVSGLEVHGETVRCSVRGPVDPVIKAAARYEVVDLRSHEPGLEELFLQYYPAAEVTS